MEIKKYAVAGTMESSDVYVEVEPCNDGIKIELESVVLKQFGESIKNTVIEVLAQQDVKNALIRIKDRGALDCVIRARVETALFRGKEEN